MLHSECTKAKCQMPVLLSVASIISQNHNGLGITTQRSGMMDAPSLTDKTEFVNSSLPSANVSEVIQGVALRCHNADIGHTSPWFRVTFTCQLWVSLTGSHNL